MNFDEQKLKRLDNIKLNDNQYENVIPFQSSYLEKFKTPVHRGFFFVKILYTL